MTRVYPSPEDFKILEIKILALERDLNDMEEKLKHCISALTHYAGQYNGHIAKEILNLVTLDGH